MVPAATVASSGRGPKKEELLWETACLGYFGANGNPNAVSRCFKNGCQLLGF